MPSPQAVEKVQALIHAGRFDDALAAARQALRTAPADATLHLLMAAAHDRLLNKPQALFFAEKALALAGRSAGPNFCAEAGLVFLHADRLDQARAAFEAGSKADATNPRPRLGLVSVAVVQRRYATGARLAAEALALAPDDRDAAMAAAGCLLELGRADEALAILRTAADRGAPDARLLSQVCCTAQYAGADDAPALARFAQLLGPPPPRPPIADPDPERRLTIGLVSPDLVGHSVAAFIGPLLAALDAERFRAVCYSTIVPSPGDAERRPRCYRWRDVPFASDSELARQVREDGVDILIDLSGHTVGHRLPLFHGRAAPVQVTYLGYPGSTGLGCFDARLVDSITDPPGTVAAEPLVRLDPCFLAFPFPSPPDSRPPEGPFTFASFNALSKIGPELVASWARILNAAPGSRLLLKAFALAEDEVRQGMLERFAAAGVDPARIDLLAWTPTAQEHRALYRGVHLVLDTFPYNGTTTTCEALAMGVPVLIVEGRHHAGRVGASLLGAAGLPELVAPDLPGYEALAVEIAADAARAPALRRAVAERLPMSSLAGTSAWARRFESALRALWRSAARP